MGIPVAGPIAVIPPDAKAMRALQTPQVSTVTVGGEQMRALILSRGKLVTIFYDLTSLPPVQRQVESAAVEVAEGSGWKHASVVESYSDAELTSVLSYLRSVIK